MFVITIKKNISWCFFQTLQDGKPDFNDMHFFFYSILPNNSKEWYKYHYDNLKPLIQQNSPFISIVNSDIQKWCSDKRGWWIYALSNVFHTNSFYYD